MPMAAEPARAAGLRRDARSLGDWMARLPGYGHLVLVMAGLLAGWWLYVPVHELLHVAGCVFTGGSVTRLELSPEYGGALLAHVFDWVVPESDYAGRLSGFDTGGSDGVYLATVYAPYLPTIFPGFLLWQAVMDGPLTAVRALAFGALLPWVTAPLLSLTGDFYEFGSILASLGFAAAGVEETGSWRSDDLFRLVGELAPSASAVDWAGVCTGVVVGIVFALLTLAAGSRLGHAIRRQESGR